MTKSWLGKVGALFVFSICKKRVCRKPALRLLTHPPEILLSTRKATSKESISQIFRGENVGDTLFGGNVLFNHQFLVLNGASVAAERNVVYAVLEASGTECCGGLALSDVIVSYDLSGSVGKDDVAA